MLLHGFPEFWYAWRGAAAALARAGFRFLRITDEDVGHSRDSSDGLHGQQEQQLAWLRWIAPSGRRPRKNRGVSQRIRKGSSLSVPLE